MRFFCIEFRPKVPIAAQPFSCTAALEGCARRAATTASMAPHPPALTDLVGTVVGSQVVERRAALLLHSHAGRVRTQGCASQVMSETERALRDSELLPPILLGRPEVQQMEPLRALVQAHARSHRVLARHAAVCLPAGRLRVHGSQGR